MNSNVIVDLCKVNYWVNFCISKLIIQYTTSSFLLLSSSKPLLHYYNNVVVQVYIYIYKCTYTYMIVKEKKHFKNTSTFFSYLYKTLYIHIYQSFGPCLCVVVSCMCCSVFVISNQSTSKKTHVIHARTSVNFAPYCRKHTARCCWH